MQIIRSWGLCDFNRCGVRPCFAHPVTANQVSLWYDGASFLGFTFLGKCSTGSPEGKIHLCCEPYTRMPNLGVPLAFCPKSLSGTCEEPGVKRDSCLEHADSGGAQKGFC